MGRKKKIWNDEKLNTLYECWKKGQTPKERIILIGTALPEIPLPTALSMMRNLARTDSKWVGWNTRKTNEKERDSITKQKDKERKIQEREQKRNERLKKRLVREEKEKEKELREKLHNNLEAEHASLIAEKVPPSFFFCPDTHQFVNNNSCIYRVFSKDFPSDVVCAQCKRMDTYIPIVEEVICYGRSKQGNKTSKGSEDTTK
jgi:flagellar biosynthesis GTPase FlhF